MNLPDYDLPEHAQHHGVCVLCGVPWPCAYAGEPQAKEKEASMSATTDTPRPWYTDEVYPRDCAEIEIKHPQFPDGGRLYGTAISETEDGCALINITLDEEQPTYDNDKLPEDLAYHHIFIWDKARGSWLNESKSEVALDRMVWRYVVSDDSDTRHCAPASAALIPPDRIHPVDALERLASATGLPPLDPDKLATLRAYCDAPVVVGRDDRRLLPDELPIAVFLTFEAARIAASTRIGNVTWWVQTSPLEVKKGWSVRINPGNTGAWMREVRG